MLIYVLRTLEIFKVFVMLITIFTPSYNRGYIITNLYESLCNQTDLDFEWIIVDDGSVDDTCRIVDKFCSDRKINIRYFRQNNKGKHVAINRGVVEAKGELFFIVDSDDKLVSNAIELIKKEYNEIKDDLRCAGIGFMRADFSGKKIGTNYSFNKVKCNALDFTKTYNVKGDMAELYKTSVLKKYPFPEFPNERFCPEALVWFRIAESYTMLWVNSCIYLCEYLHGGLTDKITYIRHKSPRATTLFYYEQVQRKVSFKERIKAAINLWRFSFGTEFLGMNIKKTFYVYWLFLPLGLLFYINDMRVCRTKHWK